MPQTSATNCRLNFQRTTLQYNIESSHNKGSFSKIQTPFDMRKAANRRRRLLKISRSNMPKIRQHNAVCYKFVRLISQTCKSRNDRSAETTSNGVVFVEQTNIRKLKMDFSMVHFSDLALAKFTIGTEQAIFTDKGRRYNRGKERTDTSKPRI